MTTRAAPNPTNPTNPTEPTEPTGQSTPAPNYPWEHHHRPPGLPKHVRLVLHAAQTAEQAVTGPDRRRAFETTRILLGGALDAGYTIQAISDCLGVRRESVKSRAETGRELTLTAMEAVAGLNPETLTTPGHPAIFGAPRQGENGELYYSAAAIIRGLAILP